MAIVEDEVRNESEEENEIEVVVEEDDAEQDSDDSEDEDDEEALERKVADLERQITEHPNDYNIYDYHIELIQALWSLSELDRWRAAFNRLQEQCLIQPEHWLLRLQTEESLAHSPESRAMIAELYQQASLDCYSIPIFSEWCSWSLGAGSVEAVREQMEHVLKLAGADPLSGKLFWNAKLELEKAHLDSLSQEHPDYLKQKERVLWCLEEIVSRPLLRNDEALPQLQEIAKELRDKNYIDKIQIQHEAAAEYLQKITPFEDRLLIAEKYPEDLSNIYQEFIDTVKELGKVDKYAECDSNGILNVLYSRASSVWAWSEQKHSVLSAWAAHARSLAACSRADPELARVLLACARRSPHRDTFWVLAMQHAERAGGGTHEVKSIFEKALSKGMETYKQAEALWMCYLEMMRRNTSFDNAEHVDTLRRSFRLAWDSLAEAWGDEANDCEIPLFWARLEYKRMKDPKQGKEIFEEIFKYGDNKTMSKYWEALIHHELSRDPPLSENKTRDLYKRALKFITDYPPSVARMWTDYERDYGQLDSFRECVDVCEAKTKEWRESYQAMKDKLTNQKQKGKQSQNKKNKFDSKKKRKEDDKPKKGKRKSEGDEFGSGAKKKKDDDMEVEESKGENDTGSGVKRTHSEDDIEVVEGDKKRQRTDSLLQASSLPSRDDCTLFVSNLEFKVNEDNLRKKLSDFGDIVSLRVRTGVKAFGGSICYCQYKSPESVEKALAHDRALLDGRPMFLSRYSASKAKPSFKYATTQESNKLFVKNLPHSHCTKEELTKIFDKHGSLKDIRIVTFKDGKPKGLAYIEYSDEKGAASALEQTNGLLVGDRHISVAVSAPPPRAATATPASLGAARRDATGGMRRTQLSSFIPSVLQRASTSKAIDNGTQSNGNYGNGSHDNGDEKRPLNNSDFRNMLLNK